MPYAWLFSFPAYLSAAPIAGALMHINSGRDRADEIATQLFAGEQCPLIWIKAPGRPIADFCFQVNLFAKRQKSKEEEQMPDLHPRASPWHMLDGMRQWWRNWQANSRVAELACCGDYEVERMARDLGMPASELRELADHGPEAADLLLRRMAALNLDSNEVGTTAPGTLQDLQRLCTLCESHRRCARDLGRAPDNKAWEDYCPNVAMLKLLDSLPWASRSEW